MIGILPLLIGVILAQIAPGPNMMAVASASFGGGRRAGLATAGGIAGGVLVWSGMFAFGAGALILKFPQVAVALKLVGGAYLVFLAIRAIRSAASPQPTRTVQSAKTRSLWVSFATGLGVVLTNPKAALMWIAVALFAATSNISSLGFVGVGLFAACSAFGVYGGYALLFSTGVALRAYARFFRWIEALFGAVFGAIGAKFFADGVADLRNWN